MEVSISEGIAQRIQYFYTWILANLGELRPKGETAKELTYPLKKQNKKCDQCVVRENEYEQEIDDKDKVGDCLDAN